MFSFYMKSVFMVGTHRFIDRSAGWSKALACLVMTAVSQWNSWTQSTELGCLWNIPGKLPARLRELRKEVCALVKRKDLGSETPCRAVGATLEMNPSGRTGVCCSTCCFDEGWKLVVQVLDRVVHFVPAPRVIAVVWRSHTTRTIRFRSFNGFSIEWERLNQDLDRDYHVKGSRGI